MEEVVTNVVADTAVKETVVTTGRRSGLVICAASIATLGVAYGAYRLINHFVRKKKKSHATAETNE